MIRIASFVAVALAMTACATKYQPQGFSGGFSESWQSSDRVMIEFHGNMMTSALAVRDMAILRAADLARAHGFPRFAVLRDQDATSSTYSQGWTSPSGRTWDEGTETRPGARILVRLLQSDATGSDVYDVDFVETTMGPKYKR